MFAFSNSNNILGILKQLLVQLIPAEAENQITIQALLSLFIYTHVKTTGIYLLAFSSLRNHP